MIADIMIVLTGVIAVYLTQQKDNNLKRYACLVGIIGQPFWIYSTWQAEMWGMLVVSVIYTFVWMVGIKNNWLIRGSM